MILLLDTTACAYTWMMTPWVNGTYTTESFSVPRTEIPSNILAGTHPIPELPGPLRFSGSVPASTNPQVGLAEPQFETDARAAHASVGRSAFQDAWVSWSFEPGNATAPFNDSCAGATFLFGNAQQDTSFATLDPADPAPGCGGGDRSVWFFFSSVDGIAQISTAGSGYSTVVSVSPMTPSCSTPATEIACGSGGATVPVEANGAYRVQVRRAGSGGTGALQLAVQVPEASGAIMAAAALALLAGLARARRDTPLAAIRRPACGDRCDA